MQKKGLAILLSALMIVASALPAGAAVNPFSDVVSDHWAYEAIIKLASAGLIEGYPDGTFGGDRNFTRYEMAMVFARILARFEALIDEKIASGIDAKALDLAKEIEAARQALAKRIDENYDELSARIAALESAGPSGVLVHGENGSIELTDEARAAIRQLIADELSQRLEGLATQAELDDLARRILRLEGSTPSRAEAELIAEKIVADALADQYSQIEAALGAASGDLASLRQLIDQKVDELANNIDRLAAEFRPELERLGVQVADLERRMTKTESDVAYLMARSDNVVLSGKNETTFEFTSIAGAGTPYKDPRDPDGKHSAKDVFQNKFTLGLEALVADNVELTAELVAATDVFGGNDGSTIPVNLHVDVTTPGVLRLLHIGNLDNKTVGASFDKYTFDAKEDRTKNAKQGASFELVYGGNDSTTLNGFLSRTGAGEHAFGSAIEYTLSPEFDLTFRGVRKAGGPDSHTAMSVTSVGAFGNLDYRAVYASVSNKGDAASAIEASAELPFWIGTAQFDFGTVGADYDAGRYFGRSLKSGSRDWLENHLKPADDYVAAGETQYQATFAAPLFGVDTTVAYGQRDLTAAGGDSNVFTQVQVAGIDFAGMNISALYDQRTNQDSEVDNTVRAAFDTTIVGFDVEATIHRRTNDQVAGPENQQQGVWLAASRELDFLLPVQIDARYGMNQALSENYSRIGVSSGLHLGEIYVSAGYSTESNAIGRLGDDVDKLEKIDNIWWKNAPWQVSDASRQVLTVGAEYTIRELLGADVKTEYEYQVVRVDNAVAGAARNTFRASFEEALRGGEAILSGEAKVVTGGRGDSSATKAEPGNDTDVTAKLKLTYPVFSGANLNLGGEYVSSTGAKQAEYQVYSLSAGMTLKF